MDDSLIFARSSVRSFLDRPVEPEKLERLMRAAMAAPSAKNQQPWEFALITDLKTRRQLSKASPYTKPALAAPLVVVALARSQGLAAPDMWQQDMAAATENMLLEAAALGLGGVWMGIAPKEERMDKVAEIIGAPEGLRPFCLVAIGYPSSYPAPKDRFDPERVHYNGFLSDGKGSF